MTAPFGEGGSAPLSTPRRTCVRVTALLCWEKGAPPPSRLPGGLACALPHCTVGRRGSAPSRLPGGLACALPHCFVGRRGLRPPLDSPADLRARYRTASSAADYGASGGRGFGGGDAPPGAGDQSTGAIVPMSGSSWSVSAIFV